MFSDYTSLNHLTDTSAQPGVPTSTQTQRFLNIPFGYVDGFIIKYCKNQLLKPNYVTDDNDNCNVFYLRKSFLI